MMHEEYIGARSLDRGRRWRIVLGDAPGRYAVGPEVGTWTLRGSRAAYFVGACPACSTPHAFGTVSLTVTKDGGRTFRMYKVPALTGYGPTSIRVSGRDVIIRARARVARKTGSPPYEIYAHKTVTVHVA
jgi:hypothetical protein